MKKETARWVRKAEADLVGARRLIKGEPPVHDLVCFHCQQSAEKYFKALLQERGLSIPRTHNLEDLLDLLLPQDPLLKSFGRTAITLTRYAVDVRYLEENTTKRQATAAIRQAEVVRRGVRSRLGLRP